MKIENFKLIDTSLKFIYDEHVGNLISIPSKYINDIEPNKVLKLTDILKSYNEEIHEELVRFGKQLRSEATTALNELKVKDVNDSDKEKLIGIVSKYCEPDLYLNRFDIFIESIVRHMSRFGVKLETENHRIDISKSICSVGAQNTTRTIVNKIANDLEILMQSQSSSKEEIVKLSPSFMGIGINVKALFNRCRKT